MLEDVSRATGCRRLGRRRMQIQRFDNFEDLLPWADDWDRMAAGVPFRSWAWATTWWRHYGATVPGRRLCLLVVFDRKHTMVGVAPWYVDGETDRHRTIRFLGSGEVCSDYLSLLVEPGMEKAVAGAVAQHLLRAEQTGSVVPRWDTIELTGVDARDISVDWLTEHLALAGCMVHHRMGPPCRRAMLPGSLDAYLDRLSKNSRRKVRRLRRRMLESGRCELRTATNLTELNMAMNRFIELHQRRQRMLDRSGCFASSQFAAFHRDVARQMLTAGQLMLHTLWIDDRPAAAEYQFIGDGVVYAYQSGIDPTRMDLQPGHVLQLAVIAWAIRNGYRAYDFLRGDEPYKSHWNASRRDSLEIRIAACRPGAQLRHAAWVAGVEAKRWIRQSLEHLKQH